MLLDNTKDKDGAADKTVAGWLSKYTEAGDMDLVTGYFTIGALSWLNERINGKIERFRLIWGGIAGNAAKFDLLNQEIGIDNVLRLRRLADDAIRFLEQEKVEVKNVESDFCHAKLFLLNADDGSRKFFVTGNSNLTKAGLGVGPTNHLELNVAVTGDGGEYAEFAEWFEALWNNTQKLREAKQDFLDEITKVFDEYKPYDVYMKIVSELLPEENWLEKIEQRLGRTSIYTSLYGFQRMGVVSLVKMLEKKNGAVLADAVGLGKTFTALAVIKYYRMQNREVVVLTHKRLRHNWEQYTRRDGTVHKSDHFDYEIVFHTDLTAGRLGEERLERLTNEKPKLFVIDESQDLQNDKENRYQFLLEIILRSNRDVKVLMLSAAPLNNSFSGIRNRIKLINGFDGIDAIFRRAQERLNEWSEVEHPTIGALTGALRGIDGGSFLNLTDSLILARTRKMVTGAEVFFPKHEKPTNIFETPNCLESAKTISEIIDLLPLRLSAYMPAAYAGLTNNRVDPDDCKESLRLVKMIQLLLVKRLESSWVSFKVTLEKILACHRSVLQTLETSDEFESGSIAELLQDEDSPEFEAPAMDKKKKIPMKDDIKDINTYEKDLMIDIDKLDNLLKELEKFSLAKDLKIRRLIETVEEHILNSNGSQKALIFTMYGDTAEYLFNCLRVYFGNRANVECVTEDTKDIDTILKRFSPSTQNATDERFKHQINILISTDVLSKGHSLRDCDCVVNYDIHWDPVRAIQRIGRIDGLGSKNKTVRCVNFWPSKDIEEYLDLPERIEKRMATLTIAEDVPCNVTDDSDQADRVSVLVKEQIKKSLRTLQNNAEEVEPECFGLSHLSLEGFRQDLAGESVDKYKGLPRGIYSGFEAEQQGIIALLQHKKSNEQRIAFIDGQGAEVLSSRQEILQFLHENKDKPRYVPEAIENCDGDEMDKLSQALRKWIEFKIGAEIKEVIEGLFAGGRAALDMSARQKEYLDETLSPDNWNLICWEVVS